MSKVVWITGLSGAGKTTLAQAIVKHLRDNGQHVIFLDGDELRDILNRPLNNALSHDRESRLALAMQYAQLCRMLAMQGVIVVIATISLFKEVHRWNRKNLPGYFEVYIKVPLEELRRRDPKSIYQHFNSGEIKNVAGLDLKIDEPLNAHLIIDYAQKNSLQKSVIQLSNLLQNGQHSD
jgi:cytidine diphosphoramidate kinase